MFWLIIAFRVVHGEKGDIAVGDFVENEFSPRLETFLKYKGGFDYLGNYTECKQKSGHKYLIAKATFNKVDKILLGTCLPDSCQNNLVRLAIQNFLKKGNYENLFPLEKVKILSPDEYDQEPMTFSANFG